MDVELPSQGWGGALLVVMWSHPTLVGGEVCRLLRSAWAIAAGQAGNNPLGLRLSKAGGWVGRRSATVALRLPLCVRPGSWKGHGKVVTGWSTEAARLRALGTQLEQSTPRVATHSHL